MPHKSGASSVKREVRSFSIGSNLQIRAANGSKKLTGTAIVFGKPADLGGFTEFIDPGALKRTLREQPDILLLRDHQQQLLLGRTTAGNLKLNVDRNGLHFAAALIDTTTANDAHADIQAGLLTGCSFGFVVRDDSWTQDAKRNLVRTILDLDLFEISVTSFPAYNQTDVDARSVRAKLTSKRDDSDYDDCEDDPDDIDCDEDDRAKRCGCRCVQCLRDDHDECSDPNCSQDACNDCPAQRSKQDTETLRLRLRLHQTQARIDGQQAAI